MKERIKEKAMRSFASPCLHKIDQDYTYLKLTLIGLLIGNQTEEGKNLWEMIMNNERRYDICIYIVYSFVIYLIEEKSYSNFDDSNFWDYPFILTLIFLRMISAMKVMMRSIEIIGEKLELNYTYMLMLKFILVEFENIQSQKESE